jgi:hypothetical protein
VLNRDNGFDAKTFATGVSLFFATFAAFQVRRLLQRLLT